jgi:hypothetical protein
MQRKVVGVEPWSLTPTMRTVAALAAIYVTVHFNKEQARLSQEKLRHDLFERRWNVFNSIFDFYCAIVSWSGSPDQIAARDRFFRAYQESRFLFRTESGIEQVLKELYEKGRRVIAFKENKEDFKAARETYIEHFNEVLKIQTFDFESALLRVKNEMADYLHFHDV